MTTRFAVCDRIRQEHARRLLYDEPQGSGRPLWLWFFVMLEINAKLWDELVEHSLDEAPNECCGFLIGSGGVASRVLRLRNEAASPREYHADPRDLFAAHRTMRDSELELVAIYHSHPASEAKPSQRDLAENFYEDVPHIIISLAGPTPVIRAFRLLSTRFEELPCERRQN